MITVFGETTMVLSKREDGLLSSRISGRGYETAAALAKDGDFPLLLTGIGQDPVGSEIVTDLVEKAVLFDSDMALMNIESPVRIEYPDGRSLDFTSHSSAMSVSGELLNLALSMHSDIDAVMLSNPTLSYNPVSFTYLDGASFLSPYPYLFLDAVELVSTPVWDRMRTEAYAICDVVRVDEEHLDGSISYKDILLVTGKDHVDFFRKGEKVSSISSGEKSHTSAEFSAHFMKGLEKKGMLAPEGRKGITDEVVIEALDYALGALN